MMVNSKEVLVISHDVAAKDISEIKYPIFSPKGLKSYDAFCV